MPQFSIANYKPPGQVAAEFIRSDVEVPFIMGPAGGGKTTAAIFKVNWYTARLPACKDGVVRAKGFVVRTDYRTLYRTLLSSWFSWFPKDYPNSHFEGGADRPATHTLRFVTPRGRRIELTVEFAALGSSRIEDITRGREWTWAWLNEADLLDEDALDYVYMRGARWPPRSMLEGDASLKPLIIGDLNPPGSPNHWIVKRFMQKPKADEPEPAARIGSMKLFQQPSGLSPQAENIRNLPEGYYERIAANSPAHYVHRFVHGKVGWDRSGMPVFPEFDPRIHVAPQRIRPIDGRPIWLGLDISGLHPGAVILQRAPNLQIRWLEEFYFDRVGPTRFGEYLRAALEERYRDCPVEMGFYDPTNDFGADKEGGEMSAIDIIRKATGVRLQPAWSNEIPARVETVRNLLMFPVTNEARGMIVSPNCEMAIEGFMSMYRYKTNPDGTVQNADSPRPEKNAHSNVMDGGAYGCMGIIGRAGVIASAGKGMAAGAPRRERGSFTAKIDLSV